MALWQNLQGITWHVGRSHSGRQGVQDIMQQQHIAQPASCRQR